jgi:hypothetical protein
MRGSLGISFMPGRENQLRRVPAMGERHAKICGRSEGGSDSRHDLDGHAGSAKRSDLLSGAPEDRRIAGFETNDAVTLACQSNQKAIDFLLWGGWATFAFADWDAHGIASRHVENIFGDKCIMHEDIGFLEQTLCAQGQEIRGPRAGSHERDPANWRPRRGGVERSDANASCVGDISGDRRVGGGTVEKRGPETAAVSRIGQSVSDRIAEGGGCDSQETEARREHALDP